MFEPVLVKNYLSADLIEFFNMVVEQVKRSPGVQFDEKEFNRKFVHNMPLFVDVHRQMILPRMQAFLDTVKPGSQIKPSYNFLSMYFKSKGVCPKHTDRPQCKYTVDICLNQKEPWGLSVLDKEYFLQPGDALIYSGTHHEHFRENKIQDENFCDLIFFHFVDKDFDGELN